MQQKQDWIKAGKITAEAREFSRSVIKQGVRLLDAAEKIEAKIKELGGGIGFPVNLSLNHIAAHYTPVPNDKLVFNDEVVKVDIGVSVNGAIGDSACTIDLSKSYSDLLNASQDALNNVIKILQPGVCLGEIGKTIQESIESYGLAPIKNLSGHGLEIYNVHSGMQIPNYNTGDKTQLKEGSTFAIEPFATTGQGLVKDSGEAVIFSQINNKPVRDMTARKLVSAISSFNRLPFALRHLYPKFSVPQIKLGLRSLKLAGNIHDYPPLAEVAQGMVSQAEHSFMIDEDGKVIVLTK